MSVRLRPVTRASIGDAPPVCVDCVFWQSRGFRPPTKARWAERTEEDWGAWGALYLGDDDRTLGFVQYGPADHFPRSFELPAGPPSSDAVLVTCAYLVDAATPWVMQSLFLGVIAEARQRDVRAIEAFSYRYPEGLGVEDRFLAHRTIFPADFLADFGFRPIRQRGRIELARLEIAATIAVEDEESLAERAWRLVTERLQPAPAPGRP